MSIPELILAIEAKNRTAGIKLNLPASAKEINDFEEKIGFALPRDFREFYSICNGFECEKDIFNFIPLQDIISENDRGENWFHFSEYMIFSDIWTLRKTDNNYEIINEGRKAVILTNSLSEFLQHVLIGHVHEKGGLYDWHDFL